MNEVHALAEKLYSNSICLKRQKSSSLMWKKNREKWDAMLAEMLADISEMANLWDNSYSYEYLDLLEEMEEILKACQSALLWQEHGYKEQCSIYMQAFHNLPRAFLPPENRMRISVAEAREYADFWLEYGSR